jgi:hypothetical protein
MHHASPRSHTVIWFHSIVKAIMVHVIIMKAVMVHVIVVKTVVIRVVIIISIVVGVSDVSTYIIGSWKSDEPSPFVSTSSIGLPWACKAMV